MQSLKCFILFNNITKSVHRKLYLESTSCRFYSRRLELNSNDNLYQSNSIDNKLIYHEDHDEFCINESEAASVIQPCTEDVSHYASYLQPSFNLASYVDKSPTLQQFVKLGVKLYLIEKKPQNAEYILQLDFDRDVKNHLLFLNDIGIKDVGEFLTKNPIIFKEDIENLQVRLNYLECKKFDSDMIIRIVNQNPFWLLFKTQSMDQRLGYFQQKFKLNGNEVRYVATKQPRLITYKLNSVHANTFSVQEEMGFTQEQCKQLLLKKPKLYMLHNQSLVNRFVYVHKTMNVSTEQICEMPEVLMSREFRIKERFLFLKELGRDQFDPQKPNYVSLKDLVSHTDSYFCSNVAKSSVQAYNMFLKSL